MYIFFHLYLKTESYDIKFKKYKDLCDRNLSYTNFFYINNNEINNKIILLLLFLLLFSGVLISMKFLLNYPNSYYLYLYIYIYMYTYFKIK